MTFQLSREAAAAMRRAVLATGSHSDAAKRREGLKALEKARHFIPVGQSVTLAKMMRNSEEWEWFADKAIEVAALVEAMPGPRATEGQGDAAIVRLHYFSSGGDWWITERDNTDEQVQAYGLADLYGDGGEIGYIGISELIGFRSVELDLHWQPKPLSEIKAKRRRSA